MALWVNVTFFSGFKLLASYNCTLAIWNVKNIGWQEAVIQVSTKMKIIDILSEISQMIQSIIRDRLQ